MCTYGTTFRGVNTTCLKQAKANFKEAKYEKESFRCITQCSNGKIVVPSYLCTPVAVDKDNYEEIIVEGGYYTADQLAE